MTYCTHCGTKREGEGKYCGECGAVFRAAPKVTMAAEEQAPISLGAKTTKLLPFMFMVVGTIFMGIGLVMGTPGRAGARAVMKYEKLEKATLDELQREHWSSDREFVRDLYYGRMERETGMNRHERVRAVARDAAKRQWKIGILGLFLCLGLPLVVTGMVLDNKGLRPNR